MAKTLILILSLFFFAACSSDSEEIIFEVVQGPKDGTGAFTFTYYKNSQLDVVTNEYVNQYWANIQEGDQLVFEYRYDYYEDAMLVDDEYSETIRFEVDANATEFSYQTEELNANKATLTRYCYCHFALEGLDITPQGKISGKKIADNEWEVTMDVLFHGSEKRTYTAKYNLVVAD